MIPSLPNEVWHLIFTQVTCISDAKVSKRSEEGPLHYTTFFDLCLVSKTFHNLAEPIFYNTFTPRNEQSLVPWAHAVLRNPRLAKHVHEVEFVPLDDYIQPYGYRLDTSRGAAEEACHPLFLKLGRKLGIIDKDSELPQGSWECPYAEFHGKMWLLLQLICVKLPNLERLTWITPSPPKFPLFWTKNDLPPPNLRRLRIEWCDGAEDNPYSITGGELGADIAALGGLLALPKLERLHLDAFVGSIRRDHLGRDRESGMEVYRNERLTWLRCTNCLLDQQTLRKVVAALPNLEIFEYHASDIGNSYRPPDPSRGAMVTEALMPLAKKLRVLSLDLANQADFHILLDCLRYYIPSLAPFERLEQLSVDMMLVLKRQVDTALEDTDESPKMVDTQEGEEMVDYAFHEYFPPSLKQLRITGADDKVINPLATLSSNVETWMPNLKGTELQLKAGIINYADPIRRLNEKYAGKETISVYDWSIPACCVQKKTVGGNADEYEVSIHTAFLPLRWRNFVDRFTSRDIRVKVGHIEGEVTSWIVAGSLYQTSQPCASWLDLNKFIPEIKFDNGQQMAIWKWRPTRPKKTI